MERWAMELHVTAVGLGWFVATVAFDLHFGIKREVCRTAASYLLRT